MVSDSRALKQKALTLFEYEAQQYATLREQEQGFRDQLSIVLRMLEGKRGTILDIGCAAGSEMLALRKMQLRVVGLDFSACMLRYARERFSGDPGIELCQGDAEFVPFRSESFDHIACLGVMEYLPDYRPTLQEIARVLRPGGSAVFSVPTRISPYYLTTQVFDRFVGPSWRAIKSLGGRWTPPTRPALGHSPNVCTPWGFRRLLREFGLQPQQSAFSNFFVHPLDRISPTGHDRLAGFLERFSSSIIIGWTGSQYLVSARKALPNRE